MAQQSSGHPHARPVGGFWWRQFFGEPTTEQKVFDFLVGIPLPALCFVIDPIVFRADTIGLGFSYLYPFKIFTYLMSGLAMLTLALWLIFGQFVKSWSGSFAGILLAGGVLSSLIGLLILPLTLFGLMMIIGVLGFTPFVVSFVYLRNGTRAMRRGEFYSGRALLAGSIILSSAFVVAAPAVAQWRIKGAVEQSIQELIDGDPQRAEAATRRLKRLSWFADADLIAFAYESEKDPARKARLAAAYKEITGVDVEQRLGFLRD